MILTGYYKFLHKEGTKAGTRLDCIASTKDYHVFEEGRTKREIKECARYTYTPKGAVILYLCGKPTRYKEKDISKYISFKGDNLSGVFPLGGESGFAYGDVNGTTDALIFILNNCNTINGQLVEGATLEIFVARGMSGRAKEICKALAGGRLDEEADALRAKAVEEKNSSVSFGI